MIYITLENTKNVWFFVTFSLQSEHFFDPYLKKETYIVELSLPPPTAVSPDSNGSSNNNCRLNNLLLNKYKLFHEICIYFRIFASRKHNTFLMDNNVQQAQNQPILHLENLTISHENGILLSGVNLDMKEGEFVYLIGKSGAGKTSLLRSLYADFPIENGIAEVCGMDVVNIKRRHIPQLRRHIGIVFQNFRLLDDRNVYANLEFVLRATGWKKKNEIRNQIEKTLSAVGIADKAYVNPMHLSEGEQQRVGIARALINNPSLILADEPTGNLDPVTSTEIMQLLLDINRQTRTTMLISTHDFMMIDKFPARVVVCENGSITDTDKQ